MNQSCNLLIRWLHLCLFKRPLADQLAIYFHSLEESHYERFRELVCYFRSLGYDFAAGPRAFLSATQGKSVFLSFDDNFLAWRRALPLFKDLALRVTFYVNTLPLRDRASTLEIEAYFDRIHHRGERVSLSSTEVVELAFHGHVVGSHTHSHCKLNLANLEIATDEIRRGKDFLERLLGQPVTDFSYPHGMRRHFPERLLKICLDSGVQTVATARPGLQYTKRKGVFLHRTLWRLNRPLSWNIDNLRIDARLFEGLTGRSAIG